MNTSLILVLGISLAIHSKRHVNGVGTLKLLKEPPVVIINESIIAARLYRALTLYPASIAIMTFDPMIFQSNCPPTFSGAQH
ncbi:hypothetical protein OFM52_29055, partial [Escherichia coli]|nr:hypothetical protein [Escherichia coli]